MMLHLILGGAALQHCDNRSLSVVVSAAEVNMQDTKRGFPQPRFENTAKDTEECYWTTLRRPYPVLRNGPSFIEISLMQVLATLFSFTVVTSATCSSSDRLSRSKSTYYFSHSRGYSFRFIGFISSHPEKRQGSRPDVFENEKRD